RGGMGGRDRPHHRRGDTPRRKPQGCARVCVRATAHGRGGHGRTWPARRRREADLLRQVHHDRWGGLMTTTPERSVPKPVFTDAEAGAKEFPDSNSRRYNYYTPQKRKQTHYEDVTVEVQPDPRHYLAQGW